jgi:hypothetical protein
MKIDISTGENYIRNGKTIIPAGTSPESRDEYHLRLLVVMANHLKVTFGRYYRSLSACLLASKRVGLGNVHIFSLPVGIQKSWIRQCAHPQLARWHPKELD